jgi:restriction system protein
LINFGADLIMKGQQRIVIQAKRYGRENRVGISAIQEVYGAQAYYKADEA